VASQKTETTSFEWQSNLLVSFCVHIPLFYRSFLACARVSFTGPFSYMSVSLLHKIEDISFEWHLNI